MKARRLMVIISDYLSVIVKKGEVTDRYYNPGELFEEVHIVMTNDDQLNPADLQKTVGRAKLYLYNVPFDARLFIRTLGFRPWLLEHWAEVGVELARKIRPDLIRCYGNTFNAFLAARIKRALNVPVVLSLHINPEESVRAEGLKWWPDWKRLLAIKMHRTVEQVALQNADTVMPVYGSIRNYAEKYGAKNVKVVYNVLNPSHLRKKDSYELHDPVRIISVGRQYVAKNPEHIIRAIADLHAHLTLVGDGPLHEHLKMVAATCGAQQKVTFHRAIPNDQLCQMLPEFDLFATHSSISGELSKAVLEPLLTGLPVVLNRYISLPAPELVDSDQSWILLVENTKGGYLEGFRKLIVDDEFREHLGRRAYAHARENWDPAQMEQRVVDVYCRLLQMS